MLRNALRPEHDLCRHGPGWSDHSRQQEHRVRQRRQDRSACACFRLCHRCERAGAPYRLSVDDDAHHAFRSIQQVLDDAGADNVEYFPVRVVNKVSEGVQSSYFQANVVGVADCLDEKKSQTRYFAAPCREVAFDSGNRLHGVDEDCIAGEILFRTDRRRSICLAYEKVKGGAESAIDRRRVCAGHRLRVSVSAGGACVEDLVKTRRFVWVAGRASRGSQLGGATRPCAGAGESAGSSFPPSHPGRPLRAPAPGSPERHWTRGRIPGRSALWTAPRPT